MAYQMLKRHGLRLHRLCVFKLDHPSDAKQVNFRVANAAIRRPRKLFGARKVVLIPGRAGIHSLKY